MQTSVIQESEGKTECCLSTASLWEMPSVLLPHPYTHKEAEAAPRIVVPSVSSPSSGSAGSNLDGGAESGLWLAAGAELREPPS